MIDEKKLWEQRPEYLNEQQKIELQNKKGGYNKGWNDCLGIFFDIIKAQPKVNEWIPIEEKLPKPSLNSVIGYDELRERCVFVQYYNNRWILGNDEPVKIIAWKPLPNPYVKEK